jgi:hypothetical protein
LVAQGRVGWGLRLLRAMGLVTGARSGRSVIYTLYDNHVAMLLDEAVYHVRSAGSDDRLARFQSWAVTAQQRITTEEHRKVVARFIRCCRSAKPWWA